MKGVIVNKGSISEEWKAVRGFQNGSKRKAGRSGCGIVIKGVDRENMNH